MPPPSKRLALFYDGTDNNPKSLTNVWRLYRSVVGADSGKVPQVAMYVEGVGNEFGERALGSIFGAGVAEKIREGYEWLALNYEEGAEIYVFGFSRGAFTARGLVQMIASCGLTKPEGFDAWSTAKAFERYEAISRDEAHAIWKLRYWANHPEEKPPGWTPDECDAILMDDSKVRKVSVKMAGVWDTVGAIGTDALENRGALTQKSASYNVRPTRLLEYGYHAMAIDEHRPMFDVTLWRTFVEQGKEAETMARYAPYYEQRWFIGAHSDVGGGYHDDRLPDSSLAWMQAKARALGLVFAVNFSASPDGWRAPIHDSFATFAGGILNLWSKIMPGDQKVYREIGRTPRVVTTATGKPGELWSINETIDQTVFQRWQNDPTYRPQSLIDYFKRNPDKRPG